MLSHHSETLQRATDVLAADADLIGLVLAGSIAHGFERPDSDVDVLAVLTDAAFEQRSTHGALTFTDFDSATYENGYVDIKYISPGLMARVATDGSEPARFAYDGARLVLSRDDRLEQLLRDIVRYPVERKQDNLKRFLAQLRAWKWYCDEALRHDNAYLLNRAVGNLVLFGGRMVLAHNERLYPYHKWFLRVLDGAPDKPDGMMAAIAALLSAPDGETIARFHEMIEGFADWPEVVWPMQFMQDSELNWLTGQTPVADL